MLFKPQHIEWIFSGKKIVTRRKIKIMKNGKERIPAKIGNIYKVQERLYTKEYAGKIECVDLYKEPLGAMDDTDANEEGYETLEEFIQAWEEIHEEEWNPEEVVWVIYFKPTELPTYLQPEYKEEVIVGVIDKGVPVILQEDLDEMIDNEVTTGVILEEDEESKQDSPTVQAIERMENNSNYVAEQIEQKKIELQEAQNLIQEVQRTISRLQNELFELQRKLAGAYGTAYKSYQGY